MASRNIFGVRALAPAGSTGNNTHASNDYAPGESSHMPQVAFQFVVEAVGATPTITFKFQGSLDNVNWVDVPYVLQSTDTLSQATIVVTGVGATPLWLAGAQARAFRYFRCVTTSNTNVTYRAELYAWN